MSAYERVNPHFKGCTAIVLATGPSVTPATLAAIGDARQQRPGVRVFSVNNVYRDTYVDVLAATDQAWWQHYGRDPKLRRNTGQAWTWDPLVAREFGVHCFRGRWADGLSVDPEYVHYGHSSSYQALGLAVLMGCTRILLVGFDMRYAAGKPRHYFEGLSRDSGEYPQGLRKYSAFDGLLKQFATIPAQRGLPPIINCTPGSALVGFAQGSLAEELEP